jgi:hypothetical protein
VSALRQALLEELYYHPWRTILLVLLVFVLAFDR